MHVLEQLRSRFTVLALIILLALSVRLYRVTNPILDWHSFRQADTASVTREYVKHGIDLLVPRFHDYSNIASGKDNLEGYRMVEFPIMNAAQAAIVLALPGSSVAVVSRLFSIVLSLGTIICLYFLAERYSGKRVAMVTALIAALLPYFVYYSRVILPEPAMLLFSTAALLCYQYWLDTKKWYWYCLALVTLMLSFLMKPFTAFLAPVFLAQTWFVWKELGRRWLLVLALPLLAAVPFLWWRQWIEQFPSGIPANDWLFNGNGIRFRPAWVRWLFYERLTKMILGWVGIIFLPLALYKVKKSEVIIYGSWWLGMLAYLSVVATGNVQHDYYQNLLVPIIVLTVARGIVMAEQLLATKLPKLSALAITAAVVVLMLILGWKQVGGFFNINHWEYVKAGAAADRLLPPDAKVIAPAFGDTMFLYQTNRTGWPIGYEIEKKIELGAEYYLSTSYDDESRMLEAAYFTIEKTPDYILLDLTRKLEEAP